MELLPKQVAVNKVLGYCVASLLEWQAYAGNSSGNQRRGSVHICCGVLAQKWPRFDQ